MLYSNLLDSSLAPNSANGFAFCNINTGSCLGLNKLNIFSLQCINTKSQQKHSIGQLNPYDRMMFDTNSSIIATTA